MTKQISKKCRLLFALLLAVVMMFSVMPMNAIAVTSTNVNEDGYIEIDSIEDLYLINQDLTANYILTADIDMTEATAVGGDWDFDGRGWSPIGSNDIYGATAFSGTFDGNGHKIIGMRIDITSLPSGSGNDVYLGLFSSSTGIIKNLELKNININFDVVSKDCYIGGVAAVAEAGQLFNINVSGNINSETYCYRNETNGDINYVGGIVGKNNSEIFNCYNECNIVAYDGRNNKPMAAGIAGMNNGTVENCYNAGTVFSTYYYIQSSSGYSTTYKAQASAIANNGTIKNCYNVGTTNQYAISNVEVANCYYVQSDLVGVAGAKPLTKGQMKLEYMYEGFDFENVWVLDTNAIYPYPQLRDNPQDIRVISNVSITPPAKTLYYLNEVLDLKGCVVEFEFENAENEVINVTADMVTGFDAAKLGEQELTVTYYDREITFTVNVSELPYKEIHTIEDLYNIRNDLNGNYILMNDIDLTEATAKGGDYDYEGRGWNPIGSNDVYGAENFSGVFDGNGHKITGMRIEINSVPNGVGEKIYAGLFSSVSGEIRNLGIEKSANVFETYIGGKLYYGTIAGTVVEGGKILNCYNNADINIKQHNLSKTCIGGITAVLKNGKIDSCFNNGSIICGDGSYTYAGGIAGVMPNSTIVNSYNTGDIQVKTYNIKYGSNQFGFAGGIMASLDYGYDNVEIRNCYNTGTITGLSTSNNYIEKLSAISNMENNINCYYLTNSGVSASGATALTDAQMRVLEMFPGFDFENVWTINPYANHPYPQLRSNIQDLNESVEAIRIISTPEKKEYLTEDVIDLTDGVIEAVYVSGKTELINITEDMITGFDSSVTGEQRITVTYSGQTAIFTVNVSQRPAVTGIEIITEPDKKDFLVGTDFDFTGAKVEVTHEDGTKAVYDITVDMTTGANNNELGEQTVSVTLYGFTDSFKITVSELSLVALNIETLPNKTLYLEGDTFDPTGLALSAMFNDGRTVAVTSGYTLSGYSDEAGTHAITIKYLKLETTFEVTVTARQVVSLELRQTPDKTEYYEGDEFETKGIILVALFDNNELEIVENYEVSGYDSTVGTKTISLCYGGLKVSFTVQVYVRAITNLYIAQYPTKTNYIENEPLDTNGLIVKAEYNDGSIKTVTDYELIGFSSNPGNHTVTVAFEGMTTSYDIHVANKVLQDVRITLPTKQTYNIGDAFDSKGMVVKAYYDNGQEFIIDDYQMTGFDSSTPGVKTIDITYGGISRSFAIAVAERSQIETGGHIIVGNSIGRLSEEVIVPVTITKNTGIAGFAHAITFDASVLSFVTATAVNGFADGTVVINDENIANGEVTILWFGTVDVAGDGVVYNLVFNVLESAQDGNTSINIAFDDNDNGNVSGENVIFGAIGGSIEVRSYWLGDLNGDRIYTMADIVQLAQYVSGKEMTLTEKQEKSADVNEDGIIDIHDVIMLNQWLLVADI